MTHSGRERVPVVSCQGPGFRELALSPRINESLARSRKGLAYSKSIGGGSDGESGTKASCPAATLWRVN